MPPLFLPLSAVMQHKRPRFLAVVAVLCFFCVFELFFGGHLVIVRVLCAQESETVVALTDDPAAIVARSSFSPGMFDEVHLDAFDASVPGSRIVIERHNGADPAAAITACLRNNALQSAVDAMQSRVAQEAQTAPFKVHLRFDQKKKTLRVRGGCVEEALKTAGVALGENDLVSVPLNAAATPDMHIRVQRVTYREFTKTKSVAFGSVMTPSGKLYVGETKVQRQGVPGERTTYYLERLLDGKVQETLKLGEALTKEPVAQQLLVGTKTGRVPKGSVGVSGIAGRAAISRLPAGVDIDVDVNGRPVHYKRKLIGEATAYSSGSITSTGRSVLPGRVAVDPREIPYGTKMYIISTDGRYLYGYSEAQDTGGFIYNSNTVVDLYMTSENACRQFGRRNVEIYILE